MGGHGRKKSPKGNNYFFFQNPQCLPGRDDTRRTCASRRQHKFEGRLEVPTAAVVGEEDPAAAATRTTAAVPARGRRRRGYGRGDGSFRGGDERGTGERGKEAGFSGGERHRRRRRNTRTAIDARTHQTNTWFTWPARAYHLAARSPHRRNDTLADDSPTPPATYHIVTRTNRPSPPHTHTHTRRGRTPRTATESSCGRYIPRGTIERPEVPIYTYTCIGTSCVYIDILYL